MINSERQTPPLKKMPWEDALSKEQIEEIIKWRARKREEGISVDINPVTRGAEVFVCNSHRATFWVCVGEGWAVEEVVRGVEKLFGTLDSGKIVRLFARPKGAEVGGK